MELINQFFSEILAFIIILTLLIIYSIFTKSRKKSNENENKNSEIEQVQQPELMKDEFDDEGTIFTNTVEKTIEEPVEETSIKEEPVQQTKKRIKRAVVAHDKIRKDNFEEFNGMRILIAEDNIINQKVLTGLLSTSGIKITIANDGQEAINILKDNSNFALILMDAHMPIVDGFQATRIIRKNPKYEHIPIVALSGDTAADDIKNMLNVGMEGHLEKPLKMDALYDIFYMYSTGNEANQVEKIEVKNKELSETVNVSSIEFNSEKGLDICGGDKEFYLEILNDFIDKYSDAPTMLKYFLNDKDRKSADKLLLDISGVSANIGADNLYHIVLELKLSIANPDDLEYITVLKTFKRTLDTVIKLINEYTNS